MQYSNKTYNLSKKSYYHMDILILIMVPGYSLRCSYLLIDNLLMNGHAVVFQSDPAHACDVSSTGCTLSDM